MKEKKKILSKFKRSIIINEEEWTYRVTSCTLHVCNPKRTKKWTFGHEGRLPCDCGCHNSDEPFIECYICNMDGCSSESVQITPWVVRGIIESRCLR